MLPWGYITYRRALTARFLPRVSAHARGPRVAEIIYYTDDGDPQSLRIALGDCRSIKYALVVSSVSRVGRQMQVADNLS